MSTKKNKFDKKDKFFMSLAFDLAKSKKGLTGVNPAVGCVIVDNHNEILSIGSTGIDGTPHAEKNAILTSVKSLKNSTLYVTLEPCVHFAKTPPCTDIIIKSGIKRVVYSMSDIDPRVKNRAKKVLSKKNITVQKNLLIDYAKKFYKPYIFNRKFKLPYITAKLAITKNKVLYSDDTKKITSFKSDKLTHYLRYINDSILVSSKTLNIDNPRLNCRLKGMMKFSPKRIILDRNLILKNNSFIFKTIKKKNTIIFYNKASKQRIHELERKGAILIKISIEKNSLLNLRLILKKLYSLNTRNLLVEGGLNLTENFLKHKLINRFYLFENIKIDPLKNNYKIFKSFSLLSKVFKNKKRISSNYDKDKITLYT